MSGTILELGHGYQHGIDLWKEVMFEMRDGKPISCPQDMGLLSQIITNTNGDHLEIGSAYGASLIIAIKTMDHFHKKGKVVSIEPFGEDRRDTIHKAVEKEFWCNVEHFEIADRFEHIKAFSHPFPVNGRRRFSTAFIDGDHSYEYVLNDWLNVKDVVDKYVMFHDYARESVCKAVIEHAAQDPAWKLAAVHGWSAVMLKRQT